MEYLLKASAVVILFYLCFWLFLKRETFFKHNRWFLLIGLIVALVFPLIIIPIYIPIEPITVQDTAMFVQNTASPFITEPKKPSFDWMQLLPIIYGIGFSIFFIQFILQFGSLALLILKNPKQKEEIFTYVIVRSKISPFSFFKWIVYNPEAFNKNELNLILTHEKVHAKQLHSIDVLLMQLACVVFWFNPLIWLYRKEVRQNLEFIADNETQHNIENEKEYQRLLLKTSVANHNISLSNNFYNSLIKERIVMLKKSRSNRKKQWRYLLILPLLAGLLMSMNTEEVYVEIPQTTPELTFQENDNTTKHVEIIFNKNMSDKELDDIKKELKSNGIIMNIKRIKRNNKGEISDINIDFETENGSANYNIKDDNGIKSFYFNMKDDGSFGVGAAHDNEVVVIETIAAEDLKNEKSKYYFHKNKGNYHVINEDSLEVIFEDSTNVKYLNERYKKVIKKLQSSKENDSIIVMSARRGDNPFITKDTAYFLIDSTKFKHDFYYEGNQPIKIITKGESYKIHQPNENSDKTLKNYLSQSPKPLIILNGKETSSDVLSIINPTHIESMTILKDDHAINAYGDKGKNGVVIIKSNKTNTFISKLNSKEKNPWSISMSTAYVDTDNPSNNGTFAYISKKSSEAILKVQKEHLEKSGITVKYSKIKRNKADEIISIKIVLKNESGDETSATYKDDDGIPNIEYGIAEGKLKVRTSTMNLELD